MFACRHPRVSEWPNIGIWHMYSPSPCTHKWVFHRPHPPHLTLNPDLNPNPDPGLNLNPNPNPNPHPHPEGSHHGRAHGIAELPIGAIVIAKDLTSLTLPVRVRVRV